MNRGEPDMVDGEKKVKISVPLSGDAAIALKFLADKCIRDPQQQAAWIIERALEAWGLITRDKGVVIEPDDRQYPE